MRNNKTMEETNVMSINEMEYMNVAARLANSEVGYGFESMDAPVESVIEIEDKSI